MVRSGGPLGFLMVLAEAGVLVAEALRVEMEAI